MNKAFVREPEWDGQGYCPRCGALGTAVGAAPLDAHLRPAARARMGDSAWFCGYARCEVAYFTMLEVVVEVADLKQSVYPMDLTASICACFPFHYEDIEADAREGAPTRIRALLAKSQSSQARCHALAADGRCCMREVQRLYLKLTSDT